MVPFLAAGHKLRQWRFINYWVKSVASYLSTLFIMYVHEGIQSHQLLNDVACYMYSICKIQKLGMCLPGNMLFSKFLQTEAACFFSSTTMTRGADLDEAVPLWPVLLSWYQCRADSIEQWCWRREGLSTWWGERHTVGETKRLAHFTVVIQKQPPHPVLHLTVWHNFTWTCTRRKRTSPQIIRSSYRYVDARNLCASAKR